jgi:hypothetical protein
MRLRPLQNLTKNGEKVVPADGEFRATHSWPQRLKGAWLPPLAGAQPALNSTLVFADEVMMVVCCFTTLWTTRVPHETSRMASI